MNDLNGQHAVITGGGTGIGAAIARRLAYAGATVTLMARRLEPLNAMVAELPHAQAIMVDVAVEAAVTDAFAQATDRFGPVSILVNNAGAAPSRPFHETSLDDFRTTLDVNLVGAFLCTRTVLPAMLEQKQGRIITVASTAGLKGYRYVSAYVAAKHGAVGLMRAVALEVGRSGITANCICPGFTDTEIVRNSIQNIVTKTGRTEDEALAALVKVNPQGRLVDPDEVAATALWLCSRDARSINGQALAIDGGETA